MKIYLDIQHNLEGEKMGCKMSEENSDVREQYMSDIRFSCDKYPNIGSRNENVHEAAETVPEPGNGK
jgi:hypothetical protein